MCTVIIMCALCLLFVPFVCLFDALGITNLSALCIYCDT